MADMTNGKTWLVTRHRGAIEWMRRCGIRFDTHETHLDAKKVRQGDTVIGTLPVHIAAEVCARGARYLHLSLNLPASWRGKELTVSNMTAAGAMVSEYLVEGHK